ncbi:MAG: alpha/beta fold hydrolase [Candidatus Omnitrophota bacterium]
MESRNGILYREWKIEAPRAALLLVHGLGAHSERWGFLSEFFLRNRVSSYAIELRGFGETKGPPGHVDSLNTYLEDIKTLRDIIVSENPNKKIFLLGESMGGLISFLAAGEKERIFDGVVCLSPAFKSRIRFTLTEYLGIFFNSICCPHRGYKMRFDASMCTRDAEYMKVIDADPRERRIASAGLLISLLSGQIKARRLSDKIGIPVFFLLSGQDEVVDSNASREIFYNLKLRDKTMLTYHDMYHALSIDAGREKIFGGILKWMEERI